MIRSIRFTLEPGAAADRVEGIVRMAVQKIAMQVLRGVVMKTPVDTGRARSNWHVSLSAPDLSEREAYAPGSGLGLGEGGNAAATITAGSATIETAPAYGMIYLSNGLPYIMRLETGWSQQAPAGMVKMTLDEVTAQFGGSSR